MSAPDPLVLVIEDEPQMRRFLRASLTSHGYSMCEAASAAEAVALATSRTPELMLLDLGLPDGDGIDLTRRLREWSRVPIIIISARGREEDKVAVLDAGADDYLTKPFAFAELLARVRTLLRRPRGRELEILQVGDLEIDVASRRVVRAGRRIELTAKEFTLLHLLASHPGEAMSRARITSEVWDLNFDSDTNVVEVAIRRLRAKVDDPFERKLLHTVRGMGYVIEARE